ncbi:uncharacterized protein LOC117721329 [Arvicanthis niloticus]|uniref:uncharacterized protein LOC117721329 n=1 Tax=Arvicanthis niloticus TaxID=61156 RepID=UPI0014862DD3|nr:elongin-A3 member D-like [Arvicanthis niloticus]
MESGSQTAVLQKLFDDLCRETDQRKIYQTLMELSTVPSLCDYLAEIGFRETIKQLKKQQLLVQFVKDLVAKWSPGLPQGPQDLGLEMSLTREHQSNSPEEKPLETASPEGRGAGREVFLQLSHCEPGKISRLKPSQTSHIRADPWAPSSQNLDPRESLSSERHLGSQNQVQERPPRASLEKTWQHEGAEPLLSRKPGSETGNPKWLLCGGHRKSQPPDHWKQEEAPGDGSLWSCLQAEYCSSSSSSSSSSLALPPRKRKRESPCLAGVQRPAAKVPRGESRSSQEPSPITDCAIPESPSTGQACFPPDVVLDPSSSQQDQDSSTCWWALRKKHKTQVYSGCRPAPHLQQKSHQRLHSEEGLGIRIAAHGQAPKDEAEPEQLDENSQPETQTCKPTHSSPESATHLQLQESQEERLQRLRARIQITLDKRLQARQTKMVFHTQHKGPDQQGQPGPRGAAFAPHSHSLPKASAHPRTQKAPQMPSVARDCKKAPAKRPAPHMAKALKDYSNRFSRR